MIKNTGIFAVYPLQLSWHNFAKKNIMPRLNKITRLNKIISITFIAAVSTSALPAVSYGGEVESTVTVYAGPQSVSPNQTIFVTVEATDEKAESLMNTKVELSYKVDGRPLTMSGKTTRGLALFEVPAQNTAGVMTFSAAVKGVTSRTARVLVTANAPQAFALTVKQTKQPRHIAITSSVIADGYGNRISDMSVVSVDWIDMSGLTAQQMIQPTNGRIIFTAMCPKVFAGALRVRTSLQTQQITTSDISSLCTAKQG